MLTLTHEMCTIIIRGDIVLKDNLKALRESKKLTKKTVAENVGITERAYIAYEYGERDVSTATLSKLADFYHVTTDYLLGRETGEPETIDQLASEFNMSALEKKILDNYLSLPKNMRTDLMEFLHKSVKEVHEESIND